MSAGGEAVGGLPDDLLRHGHGVDDQQGLDMSRQNAHDIPDRSALELDAQGVQGATGSGVQDAHGVAQGDNCRGIHGSSLAGLGRGATVCQEVDCGQRDEQAKASPDGAGGGHGAALLLATLRRLMG